MSVEKKGPTPPPVFWKTASVHKEYADAKKDANALVKEGYGWQEVQKAGAVKIYRRADNTFVLKVLDKDGVTAREKYEAKRASSPELRPA